ncbi:MAG: hypothetical protein PWP23_247 [Candidatus Sumerlaeota bacterium]|nr:hypothetical protein [Candidatus Sumerlaeota bacterium]
MKRTLTRARLAAGILVLAALLPLALSSAEDSAPEVATAPCMRIAFVDMDRIIPESTAIRTVLDQADAELAAIGARIDDDTRELERRRLEYERQKGLFSADGAAQKRAELNAFAEQISEQTRAFERELRIRERQLDPLMGAIHDTVAAVAQREEIDVVLRGENVLYGVEAADMTDKVIADLDARRDEIEALFAHPDRVTSTGDEPTTAPAVIE